MGCPMSREIECKSDALQAIERRVRVIYRFVSLRSGFLPVESVLLVYVYDWVYGYGMVTTTKWESVGQQR